MTSLWGPMGWITLHSISVAYPENPTISDKMILDRFMNSFGECITCPHCKEHFGRMFSTYKRGHPEWNSSKYNLFLAICRMHNTVNRRLDKPLQKTVAECIETLRNATTYTSSAIFRQNYVNHVIRNWAAFQSGEGMMMIGFAKEMGKINAEYWNPRDISFSEISFPEANVLEFVPERSVRASGNTLPVKAGMELPRVGFKVRNGRLGFV
jgi:hypothetical protein